MKVQATPAVALFIAHHTTKIIRSRSLLDGVSWWPKDQSFTRRLEIVVFRHPHPSPHSPTGVAGVWVSSGQERRRHRQIRFVSVPPDHDVIDSGGGSVEAEPGVLPAHVRHRLVVPWRDWWESRLFDVQPDGRIRPSASPVSSDRQYKSPSTHFIWHLDPAIDRGFVWDVDTFGDGKGFHARWAYIVKCQKFIMPP